MLHTEVADRERHLTDLSEHVERQAAALKIYRQGAHGLDLGEPRDYIANSSDSQSRASPVTRVAHRDGAGGGTQDCERRSGPRRRWFRSRDPGERPIPPVAVSMSAALATVSVTGSTSKIAVTATGSRAADACVTTETCGIDDVGR